MNIPLQQAEREAAAVATLCTRYGVPVPEQIAEARETFRRLRTYVPPTVSGIGANVLDAPDLDKGLRAATKALTEVQAAREALDLAREEARFRAIRAVANVREDVLDALVSSPAVADAVAVLAEVAPTISPSTPARVSVEAHGAATVIAVARVREAEDVLRSLATAISATGLDPIPTEHALALAVEVAPDVEVYRLGRALSGVRPGEITGVYKRIDPMQAPGTLSTAGPTGIPSAVLAALDGVTFRSASTWAEVEERLAVINGRGLSIVEDETGPSGLVVAL